MPEITRETFEQMAIPDKLNVLFDYTVAALTTCQHLDDKTDKLEKKAMKWGGAGGIITAIGAYLAALFINHISK